jgi:hypothetical protein
MISEDGGAFAAQWHGDMSFEEIVEVRDELNAMLQRIRAEGQFISPFSDVRNVGMSARARSLA